MRIYDDDGEEAGWEADKCPQCGKFVGEGYGKPGDEEYSPGFGDREGHVDGCENDEWAEDHFCVAIFCNESCADRFHKRPKVSSNTEDPDHSDLLENSDGWGAGRAAD